MSCNYFASEEYQYFETKFLSNELNNLYLSYEKQLYHVTTRRDQSKRQKEKANKECVESVNQYSSSEFQNTTLSNDTTLLNILESLLADNTDASSQLI